ncbi:MAG: DNA replication and repair protein RecF [Candidatus Eisenbacteria bacterium]|nr:DNA replication and repair protein RecF [Candidatus Eisenbacteria bacterium]
MSSHAASSLVVTSERRVWLSRLRLENFRNYESLELELENGLNFFHGPNGSGKTSLLEAVSYLAVARSLRGANDGEVVRWGESGFGVGGRVETGDGSTNVVVRYARGGRKEATVDGDELTRLSELVGSLRVAWFCPEDTWITKGGPAERRRLIDVALCQIDRSYLSALVEYRRALRQRNEALSAWTPDEESDRLVAVWTQRLVESGSRVVGARLRFLPLYRKAVKAAHAAIAEDEGIDLVYRGSFPAGDEEGGASDENVKRRFNEALSRAASDERRRGFTLVGPHRDDVEVRVGGRPLRTFGSQGQHRTAAIALKLGEAAVLDEDGRGVVVLLDDILSELDDRRGGSLVDLVGRYGQALVTSTRPAPPGFLTGAASAEFAVGGGEVTRT